MPDDGAPIPEPHSPVTSLDDARAVQILTAEHASLLSARSLAYNEAFARAGMFLAFLSFSFVAIALLAQVLPLNTGFLLMTIVVLVFDLVVGVMSYGRIIGAGHEDYRAVHGMARIRHAYGEIAPIVLPYFVDATHDDLEGVMVTYGSPPLKGLGALIYQFTTSAGLMNVIVSMVGGVLASLVAVVLGASVTVSVGIGAVAALGLFVALAAVTILFYVRVQERLEVRFPTPKDGSERGPDEQP